MRESARAAAVVFDLDGVLIDSEGVWDDVRRELADEAGRPWPAEASTDMMGMSSLEWSAYMRDEVGVPRSAEAINDAVVSRLADRYEARLPLIRGAAAAVRRIARRYPIALASSSNRRIIDAVLAGSGLGDCFSATVSSEEVGVGKPAPDVYVEAAARLSVPPSGCVAVEDSGNGIRSAASAGMPVIAIPNREFPPDDATLALAASVLPSIVWLWPRRVERLGAPATP